MLEKKLSYIRWVLNFHFRLSMKPGQHQQVQAGFRSFNQSTLWISTGIQAHFHVCCVVRFHGVCRYTVPKCLKYVFILPWFYFDELIYNCFMKISLGNPWWRNENADHFAFYYKCLCVYWKLYKNILLIQHKTLLSKIWLHFKTVLTMKTSLWNHRVDYEFDVRVCTNKNS